MYRERELGTYIVQGSMSLTLLNFQRQKSRTKTYEVEWV
jgi:hypothetical protein